MKFLAVLLLAVAVSAKPGAIVTGDSDEIREFAPVGECPQKDPPFPVFLADSDNQTIYYVCSHGRPIQMQCPKYTKFDVELKTCVDDRSVYSPVGECPPIDGEYPTFLPDSHNRSVYYECRAGQPVQMACPAGLVFNPILGVCDWGFEAAQPNGECPQQVEEFPTILGDLEDCSRYYVCFSGKPFPATCPNGLVFNPETSSCDYPEKVKCPNKV